MRRALVPTVAEMQVKRSVALMLLGLCAQAAAVPMKAEQHKEALSADKSAALAHQKYLSAWSSWVKEYNKEHWVDPYSSPESTRAFEVFQKNLDMIMKHNEEYNQGLQSYEMGLNGFAHLTFEEFSAQYLGYGGAEVEQPKTRRAGKHERKSRSEIPASVDWREKGAVAEVKNQGACGSCWAFSAVAALEGAHFLNSGELISLSEQQLVDCSKKFGNHGCAGGYMDNAFEYWMNNTGHGDDSEKDYPYKGMDGKCKFSADGVRATISGYNDVKQGNETDLLDAVANVGPVSVAIHAGAALQFYLRGVFNGVAGTCFGPLNHGVTAVGYGTASLRFGRKMDYWIIKNSWGMGWGEKGKENITMSCRCCNEMSLLR
mmetsp:Transcript_26162/g.86040  ORF Transcript_26162/g.86040 Transcript_26162/m.86040 type:complete len:374 (-) Transcript_26162:231-1352(-)